MGGAHAGLDRKSVNWMKKAMEILCDCTNSVISKATLDAVRETALRKYKCVYAKRKVLNFTKGFLKYLRNTTFDTRHLAFEFFLEMPRVLEIRKHVTSRIVTKDDVENVFKAVGHAHNNGRIDTCHYLNYKALVLFGALGVGVGVAVDWGVGVGGLGIGVGALGVGVGVGALGVGVGLGLGLVVGSGVGLGLVVDWGAPVGVGLGVLEAEGTIVLGTEAIVLGTEAIVLGTEAIVLGTEAIVLETEAIVLGAEAIVLGTEASVSEGTTACWGCGPCAIETTPTVVMATSTAAATPVTITFLAVTGPPNRSNAGLSSSRQLVTSVPITKKTMPTINTTHIL